jgi:hypothetical protein
MYDCLSVALVVCGLDELKQKMSWCLIQLISWPVSKVNMANDVCFNVYWRHSGV